MITFSNSIVTKGQRGFVLLPVVMAIALVAGIAFLMNREGAMNVALADRDVQSDQARYVAEAGLNHQKWQVQNANCTGYTTMTDQSFGSHAYTTTVTPTDGSPVSITASASLTDGTSRTGAWDNIKVYETASQNLPLQPGVGGEDTYVWDGAHKDKNFGTSAILSVNNASAERSALLKFDLSTVPTDAQVTSAILGLYLEGGNDLTNGVLDVHSVSRSWVEGIDDDAVPAPGTGATYLVPERKLPFLGRG